MTLEYKVLWLLLLSVGYMTRVPGYFGTVAVQVRSDLAYIFCQDLKVS